MSTIQPSTIFKKAYDQLTQLKHHLEKQIPTDAEIEAVMHILKTEHSQLNRYVIQSKSIQPAAQETALKNSLMDLIYTIAHSPSCNQALGSQQMAFSDILKKFEQVMRKWESKVEKVDPML